MWKPIETQGTQRDQQKKMFVEGHILFRKQVEPESDNGHSSLYALRHNNGIFLVPNTESNRQALTTGLTDIEKAYNIIEFTPNILTTANFLTSLSILQEKRVYGSKRMG